MCIRDRNKREQRIVFIHGKGDGVLRKALLDELKRKYPTFRHQDASFQEYGFAENQPANGHSVPVRGSAKKKQLRISYPYGTACRCGTQKSLVQ